MFGPILGLVTKDTFYKIVIVAAIAAGFLLSRVHAMWAFYVLLVLFGGFVIFWIRMERAARRQK
jgi:hypothetical protein